MISHPPRILPKQRPNPHRRYIRPHLPITLGPTVAKARVLAHANRPLQRLVVRVRLVLNVADGAVVVPARDAGVSPAVAVGVEADAEAEEARVGCLRDPGWGGDVGAVEALGGRREG